MIQEHLVTVLSNFLDSKKKFPKAVNQGDHFESLSFLIPEVFDEYLKEYSKIADQYKISYSHGMGNWAEIPWVVCANKNITTSPQYGYYIVLGFSADMQSCYLSLNQGVSKTDKADLSHFAEIAIEYTSKSSDDNVCYGPIDFKAKNSLGKRYAKAAIKSYKYTLEDLKTSDLNTKIINQFNDLLKDYENIYNTIGKNILDLRPISDATYQVELQNTYDDSFNKIDPNLKKLRTKLNSKTTRYFLRNPKYSKRALDLASYKCEINNEHETFSNGKHQYMEGYHLIPMSQQNNFEYSLDVPSNIISLCPNCHKALHYGDNLTKLKLVDNLFLQREERLLISNIHIIKSELLAIYKKNILNTLND